MTIKKCDRCEELYENNDSKIHLGMQEETSRKKDKIEFVDLCPGCTQDLAKWFLQKTQEAESPDGKNGKEKIQMGFC